MTSNDLSKALQSKVTFPLMKKPDTTRAQNHGRVFQVFLNTSMANGHDGLAQVARTHGIETDALSTKQFLIFINRARTSLKIMTAGGVIAHYKHPSGTMPMEAIQYIPKAFLSPYKFDMSIAVKSHLEELFAKKRRMNLMGAKNGGRLL